jgi:serine/threonine protein kinase
MSEIPILFLNNKARDVDQLLLNDDWSLSEMFDNIFCIHIQGKKLNWLVKKYTKIKHVRKESKNLAKLSEITGVPRILAVNFCKNFSYIIMSKLPGIDLFEYIRKHGVFSEEDVKPVIQQLLKIVEQMHAKKVIHYDIKPENILYDKESGQISLIDFEERYTAEFRSPEQILNRTITAKTDIWSIGITLYQLLFMEVPYKTTQEIMYKKRIDFEDRILSDELIDFFSSILERDADIRYDATDALNHVWLNS